MPKGDEQNTHSEPVAIGVDVGGTFTDLVLVGSDRVLNRVKLPSSPPNFADAIATGVVRLLIGAGVDSARVGLLLHGTTVATNAILERRGARTGLITTRGARDVLELRRLRRPSLFDVDWDKPEPLVPRARRLEIDERIDAAGQIVRELDRAAVRAVVRKLEDDGVESVAICLLNSHANKAHEQEVLQLITDAGVSLRVSASYQISPEIKEYERTSSTVINAYLQPVVGSYVDDLIARAAALDIAAPIRIMKSNGGLASAEEAGRVPAAIVESGPAAGVTAAARLASSLRLRRIIAFDMGGTTAKASLIEDGRPFESSEYEVGSGINTSRILAGGGGYTLRFPSLDVVEVGAGGGSIVWLDALGTPHIGPESAGATPGPACYGRGGNRPTVTDANVVLGYLSSESLAGGAQTVYPDRATEVITRQIASPLGTDVLAAAHGIYLLANSLMARAIRGVTTERGRDPREYALVGYGGAGPMHAVQIARDFGMDRVVIPPAPGVFSATGLLLAEMSYDEARSVWTTIGVDDGQEVLGALSELDGEVRARAQAEGLADDQLRIDRFADVRYAGQSFELRVSVPETVLASSDLSAIGEVFHRDHERMYGHALRDEQVLIVNVRVRASDISVTDEQRVAWLSDVNGPVSSGPGERKVYFGAGELLETPVVSRRHLHGRKLAGPLIIEDADSTTVVPPSASAEIGELGEILIRDGSLTGMRAAKTLDYNVDVITQEILRSALGSVADEMALTVIRTAHSQVVRDTMDFATALFGPSGELLAQGLTLPFHLGAMPDAMDGVLDKFGGDVHPGDVFMFNDPDSGGMHLPDIFLFAPIFDAEDLVGFTGVTAHQADIGGRVPGGNAADSTEIYQEGLQLPLVKLFDRGVENHAIMEIIRLNVRVPDLVVGDIRAQLAAAHTGATRFLELVERYGRETLARYTEAILNSTEAYVRSEISAMTDGTYRFTDYLDGDGFGSGPLAIAASLTVAGDEITVDFSDSAAQVPSALNATLSIVKAAVYTALMAVMDTSTGLACNAGFIRPIHVIAPAGSLLNGRRPAARAARGLTAYRVVDAVLGALHQVLAERVPAGGDGGVTVVTFGCTDASGRSAVLVDTPVAGWGGRPDEDGIDGISSLAANMANTPIEVMEADFPIRIEEYGFVPDTGGAGKYRGCVSVVRQYRFLADTGILQIRADRRDQLPYGLSGGDPGTPSDALLNPGGPDEEQLASKITRTIKRDDVVRIVVAGGGGHGNPAERASAAIKRDLESGLLTAEHAHSVYGAVLNTGELT